MDIQGPLVLKRSEIEPLIEPREMIAAVEEAFRQRGQGRTFGDSMLHGSTPGDLEFHIKSGGLTWKGRKFYGLKANGSCFSNRPLRGLPNIVGIIVLFDGECGLPVALLESTALTRHRTAAGTAVAMKYLAPAEAERIAICGCGNQGLMHVRYLLEVLRFSEILAYDVVPEAARAFAQAMETGFGIRVRAVDDPGEAVSSSRVIVTCTPAKKPFIRRADIRPGTTIAAIGADSPDKQELEAALLGGNKVVADILEQCAAAGEIHHALEEGVMERAGVHAEIGEIVSGARPGRETPDEVIIYDATGTALQDTAGAALVYEKAVASDAGRVLDIFG